MSAEFKFNPSPFDGRQPEIAPAEKHEVAKRFTAGIDSLFSKHIEDVIISPIDSDRVAQQLELIVPTEKTKLDITVSRNLVKGSDRYTEHGLEVKGDPNEPKHAYKIDKADNVKRYDSNTLKQVSEQYQINPDSLDKFPDRPMKPDDAMRAEKEIKENLNLEEQMRLNNQPVGLQEVETIFGLAEKGELPPIPINELFVDHANRSIDGIVEADHKNGIKEFEQTIDAYFRENNEAVSTNIESELGDIKESMHIFEPEGKYDITLSRITDHFGDTKREVSILFNDVDGVSCLDYIQNDGQVHTLASREYEDGQEESEAPIDTSSAKLLSKFLKKPSV